MPLSLFHVSKRVSQKAPSAIAPLPKITGTCPWRRRSRSDRSSSEKIIPAHMTRASWLLSTKSALDVCFLFTLRTNLYHIFSKTGPRTGNVSKSHGTHRYALFLSSQHVRGRWLGQSPCEKKIRPFAIQEQWQYVHARGPRVNRERHAFLSCLHRPCLAVMNSEMWTSSVYEETRASQTTKAAWRDSARNKRLPTLAWL